MMHAKVIKFWFEEISESQWWKKDAEFDEHVNRRFSAVHQQACRCELYGWRESAEGRLARVGLQPQPHSPIRIRPSSPARHLAA